MNLESYDADICIMTRIINVIGGKWKPIILYLIEKDINRFGMLKKMMPKISKKVLTEQLRELEEDKIISREVIIATAPQIIVYSLTEKGISLRILINEMIKWGLKNLEMVDEQEVNEHISMFMHKHG